MKKLLFSAVLAGATLMSCSSDDDSLSPEGENNIDNPTTYKFERNNSSTVDFNGQTTRLQMSAELLSNFNDFDNASETLLLNMFANENAPFENTSLNESSKSIKSKVAASSFYFSTNTVESTEIKNDFESFISGQMNTVKPNKDQLAEAGVAGQIADGDGVRYVNEKGLEYNQAFAKGLIGALLLDQIANNYLSVAVLDEADNKANNDAEITEEGKSYTTMEHKWDEAYGYLYGDPSIPSATPNSLLNESDDRLLFSYLGQVDEDEDFAGIAEETFEAFKKGRAAIVAGNYSVRNEQIAIIRQNLSKVIGVRAVHYLQGGKAKLQEENYGSAFHELSEGFGFIYSLRFTHNPSNGAPYVSKAQIDTINEQLLSGNGFWEVSPEMLDSISEEIAAGFDFSVEEAAE
ncbi:DUF4856 domain-containing protein [Christiangramia forsetii]|uniref:DUF4856 domain-containing protein n=2 Tax=Christiangramia forsetii TaxID=411153 RepID=A0M4C6_CHRFK|nr:DUF4856 domain-containing protein [Christiangramia forsetii]GGG23707.1 DUF4856 domain-containing protein [Christiangramia forsetii]CAL67471.1 conserved hypothetical protein, secreted [Christiangramia forsetii KT0803]